MLLRSCTLCLCAQPAKLLMRQSSCKHASQQTGLKECRPSPRVAFKILYTFIKLWQLFTVLEIAAMIKAVCCICQQLPGDSRFHYPIFVFTSTTFLSGLGFAQPYLVLNIFCRNIYFQRKPRTTKPHYMRA